MIVDRDIERFTEGDCHYLARAIHKLTGWRMGAFAWADDDPDLHAFALMPGGKVLDVHGPQTRRQAQKRWQCDNPIRPFTWEQLRVFGAPAFGPETHLRAYHVARALVTNALVGEQEAA